MQVGVLGINYKSAPLLLREQVAYACRLCEGESRIILSTCNRTEIYFSSENLADTQCQIFTQLKNHLPHSSEQAFYSFFGKDCFFHLCCVIAGLDSHLLAEDNIHGQVRDGYSMAHAQVKLSSSLHYMFQKALKLAKEARAHFPLFQSKLYLEGMIFQLIHSLLGENPSLLFIGNSEINRKIIHHFYRKKKNRMTLVSRNWEAAYSFALDYGLSLKPRSELREAHLYEGIIAATTDEGHLISSLPVKTETRLIIDLSVPRTVSPDLGRAPSLTLLNVQQVGEMFTEAHTTRRVEVGQVKQFFASAVEAYIQRYYRKLNVYNLS